MQAGHSAVTACLSSMLICTLRVGKKSVWTLFCFVLQTMCVTWD